MSTYFFNRIKTTRVNGKTFEHPVTIEGDAESRELAESSLQGMYKNDKIEFVRELASNENLPTLAEIFKRRIAA